MKLIKQVAADLFKEIGWVVFYGILTSTVIMGFIVLALSYRVSAGHNKGLLQFEKNNAVMVSLEETTYNAAPQNASAAYDADTVESIDDYFQDVFSYEGNGGTISYMNDYDHGFEQIIILLGVCADNTKFAVPPSEAVTFAVSSDRKGTVSDTIKLQGIEYPLYVAPSNMEIFTPLFYYGQAYGMLENTLFVFSHDFKAVKEIFPSSWYFATENESLLERFVIYSPTDDDIIRLRNVISKDMGKYVRITSIESFLKNTMQSGMRTHQLYMLLYSLAILALVMAMLFNIYRVLKRKIPEYAIHHLFGASDSFIFARMLFFTLTYNVFPIVGALYMMSLNEVATPLNIFILAVFLLIMVFTVTGIVHRRFKLQFANGLRRE